MNAWVDFRDIKQHVDIEQVLAAYRVQLKRVRRNRLRGRCPLPTHRSTQSQQSFDVDTVKNVWACHSASCCQARGGRVGGNVLDLVAYLERCSLREAALWLQARCDGAGARCVHDQLVSKRIEGSESRGPLAPLPFCLSLRWHPYLQQRGIHPATAARFGAGYYAGSGFLRQRIAFPIHDRAGHLVAYAGRSMDDSEPRYLFPPGFRKSQVVFNLHRAIAEAAAPAGGAIVVEGFFDCLRVYQSGYRKVVALMGSSLSETQEQLLREYFPKLILMLDGDEAGRRASQQLAVRLRGKVSVSLVRVPSGRQPDQLSSEEIKGILCGAYGAPEAVR
jgi:DNA primase